jgi:hypothetical protein
LLIHLFFSTLFRKYLLLLSLPHRVDRHDRPAWYQDCSTWCAFPHFLYPRVEFLLIDPLVSLFLLNGTMMVINGLVIGSGKMSSELVSYGRFFVFTSNKLLLVSEPFHCAMDMISILVIITTYVHCSVLRPLPLTSSFIVVLYTS